ncbi:hypothetical protein [Burkholderia territorii]|nr:hypothetical protein [Burkholderia territorii]
MKRDERSFFDRHPVIAMIFGFTVAFLIAYVAVPDSNAAGLGAPLVRGEA